VRTDHHHERGAAQSSRVLRTVTGPQSANGPGCSLGDPQFAERYTAIDARDVRFDGQFVTAVSSTGIYCPLVPCAYPEARERHVLHLVGGSSRGWVPGVPALSARGDARNARVGPAR
jgi:hypothetical protein